MDFLVLTKTGGVFGPIAEVLGWVMEALFAITGTFGVVNIGLCIILFTLVTKLLLFPLTLKQQKSSKLMNVMQPEIQAIQKKYKGKTDNESAMKMNVETREVYDKYGVSMTGGCLPLLIQLPIMLALYQVIYKIPAYVHTVRNYFDLIIAKLPADFASNQTFVTLTETHKLAGMDYTNMDKVVDLMYKLTDQQWDQMAAAFPEIANVVTATGENAIEGINRMQQFMGMNIAYTPMNVITNFFSGNSDVSLGVMIIALLIPILSGLTQWYSTKLVSASQPTQEGQANDMMKSMNVTMPLMSVFFCFTFPLGIGLYWVASSVLQLIQQVGVNAYMKTVDVDELIKKNVEKANKKRAKKGLAPNKVTSASETLKKLQEAEDKEAKLKADKMEKTQKAVKEANEYYNQGNAKPGSLAAKAGMVQKYNEKHSK